MKSFGFRSIYIYEAYENGCSRVCHYRRDVYALWNCPNNDLWSGSQSELDLYALLVPKRSQKPHIQLLNCVLLID